MIVRDNIQDDSWYNDALLIILSVWIGTKSDSDIVITMCVCTSLLLCVCVCARACVRRECVCVLFYNDSGNDKELILFLNMIMNQLMVYTVVGTRGYY